MNGLTPEQMQQMAAMLAGNQPAQMAQPQQAFGQPMQPQAPQSQNSGITGCSIPVKINSPLGSVKVSIHFGAEVCNPMGLQMAMQQLQAMGLQIDAWQPKPQGFGGSSQGGGFNRGGGSFGGNSGGRW